MSGQAFAVQTALFAAVEAALAGFTPTCAVYDAVPQDSAYPYVAFDRTDVRPADGLADQHDERWFYLSVWSVYRGQMQVLEIMDLIRNALHWQRLTISSGQVVRIYVTRTDTRLEDDGLTYMGSVTLRVITSR